MKTSKITYKLISLLFSSLDTFHITLLTICVTKNLIIAWQVSYWIVCGMLFAYLCCIDNKLLDI